MRRIRCAVYTRKSTEERLEQDFNSLDAQREACEAYISSQKHEGWELLPDHYDDGGISGGHLDRPALQRLMQAVDEKRVDQIVVYKIDRLTRSLADFAKLVDRLDTADASFVSVTQYFYTSTCMGRLTLNVLLSFAQFEREVTAERIRDKITASKRKGLWMGGNVPLGYQADGRTLKIDEEESATIRALYDLYLEHQSILDVKEQAEALGLRSRRRECPGGGVNVGKFLNRGHIHHLLSNPIYAGRIRHKGQVFEGQHPAIINPQVWTHVQQLLTDGAAKERRVRREANRSLLAGKVFEETGDRLTPSPSRKNGRRLRYYISGRLVTDRSQKYPDACRLPAERLESPLAEVVRQHLSQPNAVVSMALDMSAAEIASSTELLRDCQSVRKCLDLIARADLRQGSLTVQLDPRVLARLIECREDQVDAGKLTIEAPFRMRRKGEELKLHLGDAPPEVDQTLVRNIIKARRWLAMIVDGRMFSEIAKTEGISKRQVKDVVGLVMLAPDVLDAINAGEQPDGLTTDYLIKSGFPAIW